MKDKHKLYCIILEYLTSNESNILLHNLDYKTISHRLTTKIMEKYISSSYHEDFQSSD
jgi:hypothetical protein